MTPAFAAMLCRTLTDRELEVLQAMAAGLTAQQAGSSFGISRRTVENHLASVYVKLGVHDRIQALRVAVLAGIVVP